MISKEKKQEIIKDLSDKISSQKTIIFSDYTGLSVNQVQKLREKLRAKGIEYLVAKKTLIQLALKKAGYEVDVKGLAGQVSVTFGYGDEIEPAKLLDEFSKTNEKLKILAGIVSGEFMPQAAILSLAKLPSKTELLAKVVGSLAAPMSGLLNALEGNLRSLVYILKNIKTEA